MINTCSKCHKQEESKTPWNMCASCLSDLFRVHEVSYLPVADFCKKYYRHDRFLGRGKEYADVVIASQTEYFNEFGFTFISHHDSVTGEIVAIFGDK